MIWFPKRGTGTPSDPDACRKGQENYSVTVTHQLPFRNIQIIILEGEWVMVSKNKFPAIHFVIHHPKMCHALENMIVPVMEEE